MSSSDYSRTDGIAVTSDLLESISHLLEQIRSGDESAKPRLIELIDDRLRRLTRKMLGSFDVVRRWEQTDDVWQNVSLRIWKSLDRMEFHSARHFLNTSALQIRRELLTLADSYRRSTGAAAHHQTPGVGLLSKVFGGEFENPSDNLDVIQVWTDIHEKVDGLKPELREVFDLHWYQGLTMETIAQIQDVSSRTVKRRWQAARLALFDAIDFY